ncbi:TetR/AcrR family transcriptional regulator [Nocardia niigatensis]|uniref:TetR/AcrR family transcriptional regulator n=1 Tax=Nocardia niigatensis TaxID=209249 RepID=UPI00031DA014|nr:TetR/AcrR family transcriptional regulator [Nocardia niigatensis]
MNAPRLWRGQTLRDRSVDRREQLLEVAFELLGTAGAAAVTMRAVTRLANLSPRYFYESFDSREQLVTTVYDRVDDELRSRMRDLPAGANLPATVRAALEICADYFEQDPRRARVLLREPLADDELRRHSAQRASAFVRALAAALGPETQALLPADEQALAVTTTALSGALVALYLDWIDGRLTISRAGLADAATGVTLALVNLGH